jgi:tRNA threonylcarbamoyladenosine biosynthesis protein TsaE
MEKKEVFETKTARETQKAGELLAKEIILLPLDEKARVVCLNGDLGGGKTTFLQGFAKGLGVKDKILSPTFVILKRFYLDGSAYRNFYHIDCYRLQGAEDLPSLGFEKILLDPQNIVAIEWARNIKEVLPKNSINLDFDFLSDKKRKITLRDNV